MSSRLYSWNAYETELTSGVGTEDPATLNVVSVLGITAPTILVLEPDVPSKREFVRVTAIGANQFTVDRALDGSTAGSQTHDAGDTLRAVAAHQWLNAIFDDVEALETWDDQHVDGTVTNPHGGVYYTEQEVDDGFVNIDGDTMTGELNLPGTPAGALAATDKTYVDSQDTAAIAAAAAYSDGLDHDHATPIAAHDAIANAHHEPYTDPDAVAAMGVKGDSNDLNHDKYTDANAVSAMGAKSDSNDFNHDKYTDAQAEAANLNQHVVVAHVQGTPPTNPLGAFVTGVTTTVDIPNDWGNYKVVARGSVQYAGNADNSQLEARIVINGNAGSQVQSGNSGADGTATASPVHSRQSDSADGCVVTMQVSDNGVGALGTGKYANLDIVIARVS